ncbi:SOS response-associated peptidase [Rothia sp. P5766]|uniref:SOS response-associated peptidase n=1 Tax=Rothia sp. P5766 TaxID=3402656 RepID=UPI003AEB5C5D
MCGRYALELAMEHPQYVAGVELAEPVLNYNVAPTASVPILVDRLENGSFVRELHSARWGLLPAWAQDPAQSSRAFNARSETIFTKPTFRDAAVAGHCAIPMSGYYEWKTEITAGGKQAKTPYFVHRSDRRPIYCAGLYSWWRIPEDFAGPGQVFEGRAKSWLLSCSIITMDSPGNGEFDTGIVADVGGNPACASPMEEELGKLHSRLPVPLSVADDKAISPSDSLTRWLQAGRPAGGQAPSTSALKAQYRQAAEAELDSIRQEAFAQLSAWTLHPVSKDVGNVHNKASYLIEPVEDLLTGL